MIQYNLYTEYPKHRIKMKEKQKKDKSKKESIKKKKRVEYEPYNWTKGRV